jgi:hypothetical protein
VLVARQGEVDNVTDDLEMESPMARKITLMSHALRLRGA